MSQLVPESWSPSINVSGKSEFVRFYGASLVFEEKIALRMYFSVTDGEHTFRWNGQELTSVQAGEYRYVEIRDINPEDPLLYPCSCSRKEICAQSPADPIDGMRVYKGKCRMRQRILHFVILPCIFFGWQGRPGCAAGPC